MGSETIYELWVGFQLVDSDQLKHVAKEMYGSTFEKRYIEFSSKI